MRVDLSSLGKGRGVDRVAEYLDAQGVTNYLIDLSGKLRARGVNARGEPWRVAVEPPAADATVRRAAHRARRSSRCVDQSVATAGDYRRFFEIDGRHYSHIIDPRTGWPVTHDTVSATAMAAGLHAGGRAGDGADGDAAGRGARARGTARDSRRCSSAATDGEYAAAAQRRLGAELTL